MQRHGFPILCHVSNWGPGPETGGPDHLQGADKTREWRVDQFEETIVLRSLTSLASND